MTKQHIEVEGGELAIRNSHGDVAVIKKEDREKVQKMIDAGCDTCIDRYVSRLPRLQDYAADGSLYPDDPPIGNQAKHKGNLNIPEYKEYPVKDPNYDSKYVPSRGYEEGKRYKTDPILKAVFKRGMEISKLYDDSPDAVRQYIANRYYDFNNLFKQNVKVEQGEDSRGRYMSIFDNSPIGKSTYDRIYQDELENIYNYSDKELKAYTRKLYERGAISPDRDGWKYANYSKLDEIDVPERQRLIDWYNHPASKKRYIDNGGTEKEWETKIKDINERLNNVKVVTNKMSIPRMYVGERALYSPFYNTVKSHVGNSYTHELAHAGRMETDKNTKRIVNNIVNKYNKIGKFDNYYHNPSEVSVRIQQIRDDLHFKPDDVITKDKLKKHLKEYEIADELFKYITYEGIIELLNSLASADIKDNNNINKSNNNLA